MKKSQLIKKLNNIKGNPDVKLREHKSVTDHPITNIELLPGHIHFPNKIRTVEKGYILID